MNFSVYSRNDRTTVFADDGRVLGIVTRTDYRYTAMFVNKSLAFETLPGRIDRWADAVEAVHAAGTAAHS